MQTHAPDASFRTVCRGRSEEAWVDMVEFLGVIFVIVIGAYLVAATIFAVDGAQYRRTADLLEGENADLRMRIAQLTSDLRRLRDDSGLPHVELSEQKPEDELMPIRRSTRGGQKLNSAKPSANAWNTVLLIGSDAGQKTKLAPALATGGYSLVEATSQSEILHIAQALSTAAIFFDLRDANVASSVRALTTSLANDPLAKEVPLFALVPNLKERERLQEEDTYTAAFTVPLDNALVVSTLGAALIRRKTRTRRAEAARSILASFVRS